AFHENLAAAQRVGVLTPAPEVMNFRGFGLGSSSLYKSYEIAGSFCGFLVYQYGIERLLSLFRTFDYEESFGKSLSELGQEWIKFLETVSVRPEVAQRIRYEFDDKLFPPFHREPCPRLGKKDPLAEKTALAERFLRAGHFSQARQLFADLAQQAGTSGARDPSGQFRLREIESLRRQGTYEEAIRLVEALYASAPSFVEDLNDMLEMRARLYLQAGRFEEAMKALYDWDALEYDIWESKRRIALYRAILRYDRVRVRLIQGLEASDRCSLNSQNQYRQALEEEPLATPAHYLLARCALENPGMPIDEITQEHARKFLEEEPELQFAKIRLLRLLGKRAFQAGHRDQALKYFEQLPRYEDYPTVLREVEEWRERIVWNRQRGEAR
ncbi:MAG: tetratricopeptide repeat protein, partial [Nitrososphaera sp.]|nr:tetratricopeptide repeat protein [Nitrososphaera sp.]